MSLVLDLPEDLTRVLLTEWLEYIEYGFLDTAISNYSQRLYFSRLLKEIPVIRIPSPVIGRSKYQWMWNKGLNLKNIFLNAFSFHDGGGLTFDLNFSIVDDIFIHCKAIPSGMPSVVNSCSNLRTLKTNKAKILLDINLNLIASLDRLLIQDLLLFEDGNEFAILISQTCNKLVQLSLSFGYGRFYVDEYNTILMSNPQLVSLFLYGNDDVLKAVLDHCPRLEELRLEGDFSSGLIGNAITQLTSLNSMRIGYVKYNVVKGCRSVEVDSHSSFPFQWFSLFQGLSGIHQFATQSSNKSYLSFENMQQLCSVCATTLKSVSIVSHDCYSTECIATILQQCKQLQQLVIKHSDTTDDVANAFTCVDTPIQLTELRLSGTLEIPSVITIIQHCPLLVDFVFRGVVESVAHIPAYKALLYDLHATRIALKGTLCFNSLIMNNFINRRVKLIFEFGRFGGVLVDKYLSAQELALQNAAVGEETID